MVNSRIKRTYLTAIFTHMSLVSATGIISGALRFNHDAMIISGAIIGTVAFGVFVILTLPHR